MSSRPRRPPGLVTAILAAVGEDPAARDFAMQASADASPDEAPELSPADLAANLADFWRFAGRRRGTGPSIRIVPAIGPGSARLDRLEIVQDDRPFLVDSVMAEVADQGLAVRAMFHPVVEVPRDRSGRRGAGRLRRESMIQVILEPVGPDREALALGRLADTLADVQVAVDDFSEMLALMARTIAELKAAAPPGKVDDEDFAFLRWLESEHFVFLGARTYAYPRLANGDYAPEEPLYHATGSLGVLRDQARWVLRRAHEPAVLAGQAKDRLLDDPAVMVAKANLKSRVHRRVYMDYVGIKRYGPDGRPFGEVRFVGLFTSEAYDQPTSEVPLVRAKVARVMARAGVLPGGHNEKRLRTILENHPRDELFQVSEDELLAQALGILHLTDRPRLRVFERRDPLDRFAAILLYLPRDHYSSELAARAGRILAEAYGGRVSAAYPSFSDAPLARVHYVIGFSPGHPWPDLRNLEALLVEAARTWDDRFAGAIRDGGADPEQVAATLSRWAAAFPAGYRDRFDAAEALRDMAVIDALPADAPLSARVYEAPADGPQRFRIKLYRPGGPVPLAEVLPILDHMGLKAMAEAGFPTRPGSGEPIWVHDFEICDPEGEGLQLRDFQTVLQDALVAVWTGLTENDGFNRLVVQLAIPWREAALVRALARYRQQTGLDPSQRIQEEALARWPAITRLILELFQVRLDPAGAGPATERRRASEALLARVVDALQQVPSLDHDRVLRRLAELVRSIQRTNYYQPDDDGSPKGWISFKIASDQLADLPAPKPHREIFVASVAVEGVHMRFGPVARGGLRWSDRRDDFRTEVLGLAKAQQVKNALIVPVGAKGGFYPKQLPPGGAPDAVRAAGVDAYRIFLRGLLDLTDNLSPDGAIIHPPGVVVLDDDDPYLVVAADKGTASFSDIANDVAGAYDFWLGDAFASGGSAGYDHKAMGITARGAWEAVKRHFRELGKDIQAEPFTVVGVGDMSGDVFGNGMLLSQQIRLVAAFDHRHIFIDPSPDPATSFEERRRLFALPRSSWDDYDRKRISKGGGVFARTLKSVPLSPEIRELLEIDAEALTPTELIRAVLRARAELLYLGGIGAYVKSRLESHADVGDKSNDALRINGEDLRVRVVGEGANLGVTQAGRIEFANAGGRIDTDAIDNSAGVDTSDHEVNIKILTGSLERSGQLTRRRRETLLEAMTEDVAAHVLAHNYSQTLALSLMEMDSAGELEPHARFMARLESLGRLDRAVEGLPDAARIAERAAAGRGLVRPELAVLLAYGKLELKRELIAGEALDDPYFEAGLEAYFPRPLRRWREMIERHRLRRDIVATNVANDVVDRSGPSFPWRLMAAADCDIGAFLAGYEAAKAALQTDALWSEIAALDGKVPAGGQMQLFRRLAEAQRGASYWLARRAARLDGGVATLIDAYAPGYRSLCKLLPEALSSVDRARFEARVGALVEAGAPADLARRVSVLQPLAVAADLVDLARETEWPLPNVGRLYVAVGAAFGFDRLRAAGAGFASGDAFERTALRRLLEDLLAEQSAVTRAVLGATGGPRGARDPDAALRAVEDWAADRAVAVAARRSLSAIEADAGPWSFAKLTIANSALRELAESAVRPA